MQSDVVAEILLKFRESMTDPLFLPLRLMATKKAWADDDENDGEDVEIQEDAHVRSSISYQIMTFLML